MQDTVALYPDTTIVNSRGSLEVGGCDLTRLAAKYGTPLYVYDEVTLRNRCRAYHEAFERHYPNCRLLYASKAFINPALARLLHSEGFGFDVISAGELSSVMRGGVPAKELYLHGNNKSRDELETAVVAGIGRVVVDNFHELEMLQQIAAAHGVRQDILLRLSPGIDAHTHRLITTGTVDSKFGFYLGQAGDAVARAMTYSALNLVGLHCHIGSQIHEVQPYLDTIRVMLDFAAEMRDAHGLKLGELDLGGGIGIRYTEDDPAVKLATFAEAIGNALTTGCRERGLDAPRLVLEPGRSIVGKAGVALYSAGAVKDIPGVRRYVSLDGGMADNIRPALYEARYHALVANRAQEPAAGVVTLAGKYCESGDILIQDIALPAVAPGDIIAVAAAGAYCLSMGSNYNGALKPPVVLVNQGRAHLIRRRETPDDLVRLDVLP